MTEAKLGGKPQAISKSLDAMTKELDSVVAQWTSLVDAGIDGADLIGDKNYPFLEPDPQNAVKALKRWAETFKKELSNLED